MGGLYAVALLRTPVNPIEIFSFTSSPGDSLWNLLICISMFTTDFWHKWHLGACFRWTAFLCLSMFLLRGKILKQTSQGKCPRFPSWISEMWTLKFLVFPKYLLQTPHINLVGPSIKGLFSFVSMAPGIIVGSRGFTISN